MKEYTMFNFDYLFGDHMSNVSNQAKLFYIKLNFYANGGFVASPKQILKEMGYDSSVFDELVNNGDILTLPDRSEIFITAYFVHNYRFNRNCWLTTPYSVYWKGKIYFKSNGVATFKPQVDEEKKFANNIDKTLNKIQEPQTNQDC